jgi:hypothetical protein
MALPAICPFLFCAAAPVPAAVAALPSGWGVVLIAGILTVALLVHVALVVREKRIVPATLASDLERTIGGGNYQEAWEMCRTRKGIYLAGIGAAALEKIGGGLDAVRAARVAGSARAARSVRIPLRCLLGVAIVATVLLAAGVWRAMNVEGADGRERTLRAGELWVEAAGWFAIAAAAWIYFPGFQRRAKRLLQAADERIDGILARLPYEDLEGLRVGTHFSAGPNLSGFSGDGFRTLRVSRDLTTHCPECNAAVRTGAGACAKCGAVLDWK